MERIYIKMLGEFSLQMGENSITDNDNRSRKIWQLLAYLLCHRGRIVPHKELIELLWGDDPASSNPENALRITFHRMRAMLDRLGENMGHRLIIHKDAGYAWNDSVPAELDSDRFDALCTTEEQDEEQRLQSYLKALELYRGSFLEKLSAETWVIPVSTHFHNLYISTVLQAAELLFTRSRHREAADICRTAIAADPYHEPLYQALMRHLAALGDQKGAAALYETLSNKLFDDFGIRPSDETRDVYRSVVHVPGEQVLGMEAVLEHLQEPDAPAGALQCDYDYFKVLCFAESRAMQRSGKATHVALLSVAGAPGKPLSKRTLGNAMAQLGEEIQTNLRRGDVFSRCSVSQYIVMLPGANYENSCMVSRRLIASFTRKHPQSSARVNFMVQPLTPGISVP